MKQYIGLHVTLSDDGVRTIWLNRPERKNALTMAMFDSVVDALNDADADASTKFVVLTGAGDYFSSGNDLTNFMNADGNDTDQMILAESESLSFLSFAQMSLSQFSIVQ